MNFIAATLKWLEATPLSVFILESEWAFPTVESVHVITIALVVGTISIVDFRLLGLASTKRSFTELSHQVLPWTWGAFVIAVIAGMLLFISHATDYFGNTAFRIKLVLIVLAGLNMAYFHLFSCRNLPDWDRSSGVPLAGRIAGGVSLVCWLAVIGFGRWIGFSMS